MSVFKVLFHDDDRYVSMEGGDDSEKKPEPPVKKDRFPSSFSNGQGLGMIFGVSTFPIIGMLFHPTYLMMNSKLLGSVKPDPALCSGADASSKIECVPAATYLAAFGIGSSTMGITMLSVGITMIIGLTNIVPQAFGSGNLKLCGAYANRMMIIVALTLGVVAILTELFVDKLLGLLNLDPWTLKFACEYYRVVLPGCYISMLQMPYTNLASSFGRTKFGFYSTASASVIHWLLAYNMVDLFESKMMGISIATMIHFLLRALVGFLCI